MNKFEAFEKLKEYSKDLSSVDYDEIYDLLKNGIQKIPLSLAKVKANINIDRVRKNKNSELFTNISELSYIKDKYVIDKFLTTFGRANLPHQVMFYGALQTSHIAQQRLTAIAETSSLFRVPNQNCIEGEVYTVSRWEVQNEFLVVEVVFSEYALANNSDIRKAFENQKKFLEAHNLPKEDLEFHLEFLKFISEQFSKKVNNPDDYKISAAYTNLVLLHPDVNGVAYPSVQTDYFGVNIVLPPEIVDRILKPTVCSTQIVYKNGLHTFIANGENFCDEIDQAKDLIWKKTDKKDLSNYDEVKVHIKI